MGLIRVLLLLVLVATPAWAAPVVRVHLVSVSGPYALTLPVRRALRAKLREVGVRLRVTRVTHIPDSAPWLSGIADMRRRFFHWEGESYRRKWRRGVDLVHVMLPPVLEYGNSYVSGLAVVCSKFGVSFVTETNRLGENRYEHSLCAMAHEISHSLGANHHDTTENLMHGDALHWVDHWLTGSRDFMAICPLPYEVGAIREIRGCLT